MENDTAKMIHNGGEALLDFNRAGTPLVEIVTNPDFTSTDEVVEFLKELQRLMRYNDISSADMEKGQMRCDVNISVRKNSSDPLGTRAEIKNINSFGMVKRAIEHEQARQEAIYEKGETFSQQTRGRDDAKGESYLMRSKEDALDYRFFPEPDLPPLHISKETIERLNSIPINREDNIEVWDIVDHKLFGSWYVLWKEDNSAIVKFQDSQFWVRKLEIPFLHIKKFKEDYGFNKEYINALINDKYILEYFTSCLPSFTKGGDPTGSEDLAKLVAKRICWPIGARMNEQMKTIQELPFSQKHFEKFLEIAQEGKVMESQLKIIMDEMLATGKNPDDIIQEKWFDAPSIDQNELDTIVDTVLQENASIVEQYKWGKTTTMGFFVGQVMKKTWWKVNPKAAQEALEKKLQQ